MNVGQRVLLIATWPEDDCIPPPIGSVGEITEPLDEDGEYFVLFPDWPCPWGEPDWFVPSWAIVPIDEDPDSRQLTNAVIVNTALLQLGSVDSGTSDV